MFTDPIADLLTRIRNAASAHHETVSVPYSKVKEGILKVMKEKNFIKDYTVEIEEKIGLKELEITLQENRTLTLKRLSSPGQRLYIKTDKLKSVKSGLGTIIISTSQGIMSDYEARKKKLGGELLCEIF